MVVHIFLRDPAHHRLPFDGGSCERLVECEQFVMSRYTSRESINLEVDDRFHVVMVLQGTARMHEAGESLATGRTILIPANCPTVRMESADGREVVLLEVHLP